MKARDTRPRGPSSFDAIADNEAGRLQQPLSPQLSWYGPLDSRFVELGSVLAGFEKIEGRSA